MTTPRRFVYFLILTQSKYLTALTKQDTIRVRFISWKSFSKLYTSYALLLLRMIAFLDISPLKVLFCCFALVSEQIMVTF